MRPEGQRIERAYRDAVKAKTGADIAGGHQLAGGGLWLLKLVLDAAKTDDLDKFRAAVLAMDLPVGSALNGWGVKFDETGQNTQCARAALHAAVAGRPARHRVAGGVHDQSRQVDPARRVGPAEVAVRSASPILLDAPGPLPGRRASAERHAGRPCTYVPAAPRLHHPPGRHLRAHRGGAHPHLRRDARRQLRARRVPHAGHVSRVLGVRAAPARPVRDPRAVAPAHLRLRAG